MTPYLTRVNILIAQHVYEWTDCEVFNGSAIGEAPTTPSGHWDYVPNYAGDIAAAWPLADKYGVAIVPYGGMTCAFIPVDAEYSGDRMSGCHLLMLCAWGDSDGKYTEAPTAPLAICLACLKHLGIPLPETEGA